MKKYTVKYLRAFETVLEAESIIAAQVQARLVEDQFPNGSRKLISITAEDYVAPVEEDKPPPPFGRPNGGGTPGTPVVRVEELVDQIAEAA